jgi:hypothetical protein
MAIIGGWSKPVLSLARDFSKKFLRSSGLSAEQHPG